MTSEGAVFTKVSLTAGTFAALLAIPHIPGSSLGMAFSSLCVAALIFCVLTVPIKGRSLIASSVPYLRSPLT